MERLLGAGGQKRVYLASDAKLHRPVVIAVVKRTSIQEEQLRQLQSEAKVLAQLGDHPNIVTIYDLGEERGNPFIVCQYVASGSLSDLIAEHRGPSFPVDQALRIARETLQALAHAHGFGIIHRDVKPGNIWLMPDGSVKLGDFGLAIAGHTEDAGGFAGTPAYMAPEQVLGSHVTPSADLYAVGVVLYEMLTGRRPFHGKDWMNLVSQHLHDDPVPPSEYRSELRGDVEQFILRLMAKRPSDREPSATSAEQTCRRIELQLRRTVTDNSHHSDRHSRRIGLFGRQREIDQLKRRLRDAVSGNGGFTLLWGEPGSGKTSLAAHLCDHALKSGVTPLIAHCREGDGTPAFWPWVQILRSTVKVPGATPMLKEAAQRCGAIAELDSELRWTLDIADPPQPQDVLDAQQARFRLFDGVRGYLERLAAHCPLLLMFDDLQWADESSLKLLELAAKQASSSAMFIIGTARSTSLDARHPLVHCLGALSRDGTVDRVPVLGLKADDIRQFLVVATGNKPTDTLVNRILDRTNGNAFFVAETIRTYVEQHEGQAVSETDSREWMVPPGIVDAVNTRLALLSPAVTELLTIAAVLGREFDLEVLEHVDARRADDIFDALDEAVHAGVLEEHPAARPTYVFTHNLIREAIYSKLGTSRRMRIHQAVAEAILHVFRSDLSSKYSVLARHYFECLRIGGRDRAVEFAELAARQSAKCLAYEDAARHYEMAIHALEANLPLDHERLGRLRVELGETQRRLGHLTLSIETFRAALRLKEGSIVPEVLAQAAIGLEASLWQTNQVVLEAVVACEYALDQLHPEQLELRPRLLVAMARALYHAGNTSHALKAAEEALEVARHANHHETLAYVLAVVNHVYRGPENTERRLGHIDELLQLGHSNENYERMVEAYIWRVIDLVELGDIVGTRRTIDDLVATVERIRHPFYEYTITIFKTMLAILDDRYLEARRSAAQALQLGRRVSIDVVDGSFGIQMFYIARALGELPAVKGLLRSILDQQAPATLWQPGLLLTYAELNMTQEMQELFVSLARNDFRDLPRDALYAASLAYLAEACVRLRDVGRAAQLYELLVPYEHRTIVVSGAVVCLGSAGRFLGQLATLLRRWEVADRHFDQAISLHRQMGAMGLVATTLVNRADFYRVRGAGGDEQRAAECDRMALQLATEFSMKGLVAQLCGELRL